MDAKRLRQQLSEQGDKRREFKRLRSESSAELRQLIPAAHAAGLTVVEIAQLADLTRAYVYTILEGAPEDEGLRR